MTCRFCKVELTHVFCDLGLSPPSNSFLSKEELSMPENIYPLKVFVCHKCFLVQVDEVKKATEIFSKDYVYFSSMSRTWLSHSRRYVEQMIAKYNVNKASHVIEIASNDGYLLQYFKLQGISVLGIEPTSSTAIVARGKGIETREEFFGIDLAVKLRNEGKCADLLLGNNVLAHVPDINDFVAGLAIALKEEGIITMEFPHLLKLVERNQFDTIYHEHFSYLSFITVKHIFNQHKLELFNVEELYTHGGSLRIFAKHVGALQNPVDLSVSQMLQKEKLAGLETLDYYKGFETNVLKVKKEFISFLDSSRSAEKKIAGYGAAAKGNTLLNFCGIKAAEIEFVVDVAPSKQGMFLPGSHIPVVSEERIRIYRPDYIIIFPWNLKDEIMEQLGYIREWGGEFVLLIPQLQIL
jgi:SAM-dependent methyltransferase